MPQSLSKVYLHAVFSTKFRKELIDPGIENELYAYMAKILRECDSPSLIINGTRNHIHILFAQSRKVTICKIIEDVKKSSSKWIKIKGPEYRDFYWQGGYGIFSVGWSSLEIVRKYIANQKQHHQQRSFENEYIQLLTKYNVEYDERYVWD